MLRGSEARTIRKEHNMGKLLRGNYVVIFQGDDRLLCMGEDAEVWRASEDEIEAISKACDGVIVVDYDAEPIREYLTTGEWPEAEVPPDEAPSSPRYVVGVMRAPGSNSCVFRYDPSRMVGLPEAPAAN
jgi:hypothetical protein